MPFSVGRLFPLFSRALPRFIPRKKEKKNTLERFLVNLENHASMVKDSNSLSNFTSSEVNIIDQNGSPYYSVVTIFVKINEFWYFTIKYYSSLY